MKTKLRLLTILLLLNSWLIGFSRDSQNLSQNEANKLSEKAEQNFEEKNYIDALDKFTQLYSSNPTDIYYKLMMGICLTYDPAQKQRSIEIIEQVKITNPEYNLCNFYLAKAYAVNNKFDTAINLFNLFLKKSKAEEVEQRDIAKKMIRNCYNAKKILADTIAQYNVENIQYPINSQYSEYVPIISADESMMIFTYRGIKSKGADKIEVSMGSEAYFEDVFISYKQNGVWTEPVSISDNINGEGHDAGIALSVDGQTLFIYRSDGNGDIYVSRLVGDNWMIPQKLVGYVNKEDSWEGSCSLSPNGKTLYFASDRKGGFGGRDIYKSNLQADGSWGEVKNLGVAINTAENEDDPFIHSDNKTLYFSSEGHTSIGGYDIFSAIDEGNGRFGKTKNLGFPINTIDDNRYFVLVADGKTGYYSGPGANSIGEQDIYKINFGKNEKPVLALLLGRVYFNDQVKGSTIDLYNLEKNNLEGRFVSNSKTGKYIMALVPGSYQINIKFESNKTFVDTIRLKDLSTYLEIEKDFKFYGDSNMIIEEGSNLQEIIELKLKKLKKFNDRLLFTKLELEQENRKIDSLLSVPHSKIKNENEIDSLLAVSYLKRDAINEKFDDLLNGASSKNEKTNHKTDALFYQNIDENIHLKELEIGNSYELKNIWYDVDKYNLRDESKIVLNRLVAILKENKNISLKIGSHTDSRMSKEYNLRLSEKRAKVVVDYLIFKGIDKERLVAKGYGESRPITSNMYMPGRQKNRRTDFTIIEN